MELITKRVHTMRTKCEAVSQVTFDEDLNVPDVKPDVGRMIQKKGEIQIDEMQVSDGHVFFNGALLVALLYVSDSMERKIQSLHIFATADNNPKDRSKVCSAHCRLQKPCIWKICKVGRK